MKQKSAFIALAVTGLLTFAGCEKTTDQVESTPSVELTKIDAYGDQIRVNMKPNAAAVEFEYAISQTLGKEDFEKGSIPGTVKVANGDEDDITFTGLAPTSYYTVFARAFDANGNAGPVARLGIETITDYFKVETQYVTSNSAGFEFNTTQDYYRFDYAIGQASDKAAFEAGTLPGMQTMEEVTAYVINMFSLKPDTDYSFFARGYDRMERPTVTYEIPIKTYATDACPGVTYTADSFDVYQGLFTVTPNSLCSKMIFIVSAKGYWDTTINDPTGFHGDLVSMIGVREFIGGAAVSTQKVSFNYIPGVQAIGDIPKLECSYWIESYVLLFDAEGEAFGVQKFEFSTPAYDGSLPAGEVTATVGNITSTGATYNFSIDSNTLGFMFDTVRADLYDEKVAGSDYTANYWRDLFFGDTYLAYGSIFWKYKTDDLTHSLPNEYEEALPGTKYYVLVFPLNGNGLSDTDWGKLSIAAEFTTLAE